MVYTYPYIFDKHVINPIKDSVHNKFRNKSATYLPHCDQKWELGSIQWTNTFDLKNNFVSWKC